MLHVRRQLVPVHFQNGLESITMFLIFASCVILEEVAAWITQLATIDD